MRQCYNAFVLDLNYVTDNLDFVAKKLKDRDSEIDLNSLAKLNSERKSLQTDISNMRHNHHEESQTIGKLFKGDNQEAAKKLRDKLRKTSEQIKALEDKQNNIEATVQKLLISIPNLAHESVPVGKDDSENQELHRWGNPRNFDFSPKSHLELGENLGLLDLDQAAKLSGARFAVLHGLGAKLERALINFMLDIHTEEHGYSEVLPPFLVGSDALLGTGQLPKFREDLFQIKDKDLFLIPTAEVPLTNLHRNEILDSSVLPLYYTAYTPCFRSEAGSYGKDVRGLMRQHQFDKVELVKITDDENSYAELEKLTSEAEAILQHLELPYRVVTLSTGDMGFAAAKTYDLEVWIPSQNRYREISSCSNCTDFQARRAKIRYRPPIKSKPRFCHTLNGSGLAVGRSWLAILENFQNQDGTVSVPKVLRPYLNGIERLTPSDKTRT